MSNDYASMLGRPLTKHQEAIWVLANSGLPNKEIANRLGLAVTTVKNALIACRRKTGQTTGRPRGRVCGSYPDIPAVNETRVVGDSTFEKHGPYWYRVGGNGLVLASVADMDLLAEAALKEAASA